MRDRRSNVLEQRTGKHGGNPSVGRWSVRIERIGFTPLKGARHAGHRSVELTTQGPVGDRVFCLVDRARGRVLRTVENPSLLRVAAYWREGVLTVDLPGQTVEGEPAPTGEFLEVDYWGRSAAVEVVDGPWAGAYSRYLGHDVLLTRVVNAGEVVYGAPVTLVTTSSMRLLSDRVGRGLESARFRSTFVLDTGTDEPHVEDGWVGRRITLGAATVLVRGMVPRCAVVDLDPVTGLDDLSVLSTLGGYRRGSGEISFGVDAAVTVEGWVSTGDRAILERS